MISGRPRASNVPFVPVGTISAGNVQAAIAEAASDMIAANIPFTPVGTISAGNVQAAIAEAASESLQLTGGTMTGQLVGRNSTGSIAASGGASGSFEAKSSGAGNAAYLSFHIPSSFAAQLGIDTDNRWKVGGWSMGANAYPILHSGEMLLWKGFQSSDQIITAGGALTIAHGLPARPKLVFLQLVCQTGEHGFAAGDVIDASPFHSQGGGAGVVVWADTTNINVRFGSHSTIHFLTHTANTGGSVNLTDANWRLRFYASG